MPKATSSEINLHISSVTITNTYSRSTSLLDLWLWRSVLLDATTYQIGIFRYRLACILHWCELPNGLTGSLQYIKNVAVVLVVIIDSHVALVEGYSAYLALVLVVLQQLVNDLELGRELVLAAPRSP